MSGKVTGVRSKDYYLTFVLLSIAFTESENVQKEIIIQSFTWGLNLKKSVFEYSKYLKIEVMFLDW